MAIEVGMQNGGMATGIAIDVLKSKVAALPPGLFGTTMNITASVLANYWCRRPTPVSTVPTAVRSNLVERDVRAVQPSAALNS